MTQKSLVLLVVGVVGITGVILGISFTLQTQAANQGTCTTIGTNHVAIIENGTVEPVHTAGLRCDTLTIINKDPQTREIGFGEHDHHAAYDGVREKVLRQGQRMTITFVQNGEYHFHDHFHEEVAGTFTVH